jgi:type IV pilus biogenesis protein CpaD/CtpE
MKRWIAAAAVTVALLAGCAQKDHGTQDAPVDQNHTDNTPAQIINFPDKFENVAVKCDHHGHRIYSTTRNAEPVVVADPSCPSDWDN